MSGSEGLVSQHLLQFYLVQMSGLLLYDCFAVVWD